MHRRRCPITRTVTTVSLPAIALRSGGTPLPDSSLRIVGGQQQRCGSQGMFGLPKKPVSFILHAGTASSRRFWKKFVCPLRHCSSVAKTRLRETPYSRDNSLVNSLVVSISRE